MAAALLAPRPAKVPSMASPNTPGGGVEEIGGAAGAVALAAGAAAAGPVAVDSTAAQPCGTDSAPTRLARPAKAETGGVAMPPSPGVADERRALAMKGPMPWCSSRIALTARA